MPASPARRNKKKADTRYPVLTTGWAEAKGAMDQTPAAASDC